MWCVTPVASSTAFSLLQNGYPSHAGRIDELTQNVLELEMSTAAQQATIQEKVASVARLETQLAEMQSVLAEREQELAGLIASAKGGKK